MKKIKRIKPWAWVLIGIALVLVAFLVWFLLPVREANLSNFFAENSTAALVVNVDRENPVVQKLSLELKNRIQESDMSGLKKGLFSALYPGLFPRKVVTVFVQKENSLRPDYLLFVSIGRTSKLLHLVSGPLDDILFSGLDYKTKRVGLRKMAYTESTESALMPAARVLVRNNIVLSNNPLLLETLLSKSTSSEQSNTWWNRLLSAAGEEDRKDIHLSFMNSNNELSPIIKKVEEDFSFAAFPSIDSVESIQGEAVLGMERIDAVTRFECNNPDAIDQVKSDVRFLYGAVRRVVKSFDIDMKGDVEIDSNIVSFTFYMENYLPVILQNIQ